MTRVRVDFNSVAADGLVRGRSSRADGPVDVGDVVEAYDDEGTALRMRVDRVEDGRLGLVPAGEVTVTAGAQFLLSVGDPAPAYRSVTRRSSSPLPARPRRTPSQSVST